MLKLARWNKAHLYCLPNISIFLISLRLLYDLIRFANIKKRLVQLVIITIKRTGFIFFCLLSCHSKVLFYLRFLLPFFVFLFAFVRPFLVNNFFFGLRQFLVLFVSQRQCIVSFIPHFEGSSIDNYNSIFHQSFGTN